MLITTKWFLMKNVIKIIAKLRRDLSLALIEKLTLSLRSAH